MAKKSIIKLNEQYFSCNPINENFEDVPTSNAESESEAPAIAIARVIASNPNADDDICKTNPDDWSDETKLKCADKNKNEDGEGKEDSKKKKYRTKVRSKKRTLKGSKKGSRRGSKKGSRKGGSRKGGSKKGGSKKGGSKKGGSKKRSKKSKEGFCAGNTCLTEDNLKSLIKLLKKLELKK